MENPESFSDILIITNFKWANMGEYFLHNVRRYLSACLLASASHTSYGMKLKIESHAVCFGKACGGRMWVSCGRMA